MMTTTELAQVLFATPCSRPTTCPPTGSARPWTSGCARAAATRRGARRTWRRRPADHPETYVRRMRWALDAVTAAYEAGRRLSPEP